MTESQELARSFGHGIAFLIPGFIVVWPLSSFSDTLSSWLGSSDQGVAIGGFFYVIIVSLVAGLVISAIRSTILDSLHHKTGIAPPQLNYSKLQLNKDAFNIVIEGLYRYYQFYANMFIAVLLAYALRMMSVRSWDKYESLLFLLALVLEILLFRASRESLRSCYQRLEEVLPPRKP